MPRTKGSKNKPKTVTADFASKIAEKQSAREALSAEIASITANVDSLKADLKEKKASLKVIDKEIVKLLELYRMGYDLRHYYDQHHAYIECFHLPAHFRFDAPRAV